uniref:Uncharacterized protein n=1 Tax=Anguilla anguilla TaxID=7936 RepID=A0A0E9QK16_ANGAN
MLLRHPAFALLCIISKYILFTSLLKPNESYVLKNKHVSDKYLCTWY